MDQIRNKVVRNGITYHRIFTDFFRLKKDAYDQAKLYRSKGLRAIVIKDKWRGAPIYNVFLGGARKKRKKRGFKLF